MSDELKAPSQLDLHKAAVRERLAKERDLVRLARMLASVSDLKEKADWEASKINAEYDILRLEHIPQLMEEKGLENFKVAGLGRLGLTADAYVSVKMGMQDKLFGWFRKNKLGDLIKETVNSGTLRAFVKERIKGGKKYPSELLNVTPYTRASITRESQT